MVNSNLSGGFFLLAFGVAEVLPVHIRAQVFAADGASSLALDVDSEGFAAASTVGDLFDLADGGAATLCETGKLRFAAEGLL